MNFNQYQAFTKTVAKYKDNIYPVLGLPEEAGEVTSLFAKHIRDETEMDETFLLRLKKELGDCLWMVARIADDHNLTLQEVADANVEKLKDRAARNVIGGSGDER